jgi:hypothetical protein
MRVADTVRTRQLGIAGREARWKGSTNVSTTNFYEVRNARGGWALYLLDDNEIDKGLTPAPTCDTMDADQKTSAADN